MYWRTNATHIIVLDIERESSSTRYRYTIYIYTYVRTVSIIDSITILDTFCTSFRSLSAWKTRAACQGIEGKAHSIYTIQTTKASLQYPTLLWYHIPGNLNRTLLLQAEVIVEQARPTYPIHQMVRLLYPYSSNRSGMRARLILHITKFVCEYVTPVSANLVELKKTKTGRKNPSRAKNQVCRRKTGVQFLTPK